MGVPGPRLLPEFSPVIESTEFERSLPRRVASATASRICFRIQIWLAPTGTRTSKVGMPVSWQIGPSQAEAWSMFCAMMASAWPARVDGASPLSARRHGGAHVRRQIGRRPRDEVDHAVEKGWQHIWASIIEIVGSALMNYRTERDPLGDPPRPRRRLLRRPDAARRRELPDQRAARPARARDRDGADQESGGAGQRTISGGSTVESPTRSSRRPTRSSAARCAISSWSTSIRRAPARRTT